MHLSRSSYYYQAQPRDDEPLRRALREKAAQRRRFGYRRLLIVLQRDGWTDNHKRVYRLYCKEGLHLRRKQNRKRAGGSLRLMRQKAQKQQNFPFRFLILLQQ